MPKTHLTNAPPPVVDERDREHVVQFLAEMFAQTGTSTEPAQFQAALQTYCDGLRPWLEPSDCPAQPRAVFTLLEQYTVDATGEHLTVVLSPEGEAFFRAWVRRTKSYRTAGLQTMHAWSN